MEKSLPAILWVEDLGKQPGVAVLVHSLVNWWLAGYFGVVLYQLVRY